MAEVDFAIVGTDLFSGLLAGLLARDHGKTVVRIGRRPSAQRLWRSLPLALPIATRPGAWTIVRRGERETRNLLSGMGLPAAISMSEAALIGHTPATAAALDHLAHVAAGYGHQVRRLEGGWALRNVTMLDRDAIDARLTGWLEGVGVRQIDEPIDAGLTVLTEDAAIFEGLSEAQRPEVLVSESMTSTSIVAARPLPVRLQRFLDRGVTLLGQSGNTVLALISGERDVEARLASTLPGPFPMKRLATTRYRRFVTRDGAPLIGRIKGTKQVVVAGLGDCAPFLAPVVARFLAGTSEGSEKSWLLAHDPARPRTNVADFVAVAEMAQ